MAVNALVKAEGINGDSTIEKDHIQIFSYSFGASVHHSMGTSANDSRSGKPDIADVSIMKALDATSPFFLEKMVKSQPIPTLSVKYYKNISNNNSLYIEYKLTNVYVSSIQQSGSSENPTESLSFNFDKIEFSYYKENATNDGVELVATKGYDVRGNVPI